MRDYITEASGNIAVDDMILVKDMQATAGSHMLEGFVPLFSAEAVERLENKGYSIAGKANVGEFGLDLVGEFSYYGAAAEGENLCGGSAKLVKDGSVKAALGVDLSGAPRRSAALSGVAFMKPTYGTVSRYGVIPCACSGEQIGVYAPNMKTMQEVLSVIAGHDAKDGTSLMHETYDYDTELEISGVKVAIIKEMLEAASEDSRAKVLAYAENLKKKGVVVEEVSFELARAAQSAWQILMAAETCNNLSRYDGVKFGYRTPNYENIDELYVGSRTEGFNLLTKQTILYGSDVLSKNRYKVCYDKSLKVRRVVADAMKAMLSSYDAVLTPVCTETQYTAYDISDAFKNVFKESFFTAIPNLIGIPALSVGGVQLMGNHFDESLLMSLAKSVEGMGA